MPGRVDAAGEGRFARERQVVDLVPAGLRPVCRRAEGVAGTSAVGIVGRIVQVVRGIDAVDLDPGLGDEARTSLRGTVECRLQALRLPALVVLPPPLAIGHG